MTIDSPTATAVVACEASKHPRASQPTASSKLVSTVATLSEIGLTALSLYYYPLATACGTALWIGCFDRSYASAKEGAEEQPRTVRFETRSAIGHIVINGIVGGILASASTPTCPPIVGLMIGFAGAPLLMNTLSDFLSRDTH